MIDPADPTNLHKLVEDLCHILLLSTTNNKLQIVVMFRGWFKSRLESRGRWCKPVPIFGVGGGGGERGCRLSFWEEKGGHPYSFKSTRLKQSQSHSTSPQSPFKSQRPLPYNQPPQTDPPCPAAPPTGHIQIFKSELHQNQPQYKPPTLQIDLEDSFFEQFPRTKEVIRRRKNRSHKTQGSSRLEQTVGGENSGGGEERHQSGRRSLSAREVSRRLAAKRQKNEEVSQNRNDPKKNPKIEYHQLNYKLLAALPKPQFHKRAHMPKFKRRCGSRSSRH